MFFYAVYPAVVFWIAAIVSGRRMLWIAALYSFAVLAALTASRFYLFSFLDIAQAHVPGYIAPDTQTFDDSFYRWFFYFSPYARVLEFLLGCLTAQVIMQMRAKPAKAIERHVGTWALAAAIGALLLISMMTVGMVQITLVTDYVQHMEMSFLCGPPVAVILFCVARYETPVARFLSLPLLVLLGEMSYSIYLVHMFTLRLFEHSPRVFSLWQVLYAGLCVLCGIALTLIVSYGTYHLIEMPGRLWLRRALGNAIGLIFGNSRKPIVKRPAFARPITARRAALSAGAALALFLVPLSGEAAKSRGLIIRLHYWIYPHRSEVAVLSATYGLNCRAFSVEAPAVNWAVLGNITRKIKDRCDLSAKCTVSIDVEELGDPAVGCGKDIDVRYQCTGVSDEKAAHLPGEANGKSVVLECPATTNAAIETNNVRRAPSP